MPRAPRLEFAGAIYHVMNRGNHLEPIFKDDPDRSIFLQTLAEVCRSAGWVVHSFILMNNHYHLLLETVRPTLVKGMQFLDSTYTLRYNVRHKTRGHLFQGRYKALLVDGETAGYFLTVSDYIHLNPVRAGTIREWLGLLKHPWTSVGWLAGGRKPRPEWLRWERVYGELGMGNWRSASRRTYRQHLERRITEIQRTTQPVAEWQKLRRGWCWGSEGFVGQMKAKLEDLAQEPREADSWAGVAVEEMEQARAARLLAQARKRLGYGATDALRGMDQGLLARWIRQRTRVGMKWLAAELRARSVGGLSCRIWHTGEEIARNRTWRKRWKQIAITD